MSVIWDRPRRDEPRHPRRVTLDCGEARFTALGAGVRLEQTPIPFPESRKPELPGMMGRLVRICRPHKAAMARCGPKRVRFTANSLNQGDHT